MNALTKLEKRFLSRRICAWCEHRLDWDGCSAIYEKCSPEVQAKRRKDCLKTYRPRKRIALSQLRQEG